MHIKNKLYCFFSMRVEGEDGRYQPTSYVSVLKEDGDPTDRFSWEEPKPVVTKDGVIISNTLQNQGTNIDGAIPGISLDMTYFEVNKKSYVCWSGNDWVKGEPAGLLIATVSQDEPWKLTSDPVWLSKPVYRWEAPNGSVNEGPNVLVNDGKVYMVFSANAVGPNYATGMMIADETADLLDVKSWTKSNYPWMHNGVIAGQSGLGHNSFFTDEYGDIYNIYHANGVSGRNRSSTILPVHFRKDGSPVLDMIPSEELPADKQVTMTVVVGSGNASARDMLQSLYTRYQNLEQGSYSNESWSAFVDARNQAKTVLDNASAADTQLNEARTALQGAYEKLRQPALPLEDNNGLEVRDLVDEVDDYTGGKMLHTHAGWNNQDKGHAIVKDTTPLQGNAFTVLLDFNMDNEQTDTALIYRETVLGIGTEAQQVRVLASGKLGYGSPTGVGDNGAQNEKYQDFTVKPMAKQWNALALVYEDGNVTVYMNGQKVVAKTNIGFKTADVTGLAARIARTYASSNTLNGYYDNIIILDSAMSDEDAASETTARLNAKQVQMLWDGISLPTEPISTDLALPEKNSGNVAIVWTSGNTNILGNDGKILSVPSADTEVNLTAKVTIDGKEYTKDFKVTVKSGSSRLDADLAALNIPNEDDVRGNITLPASGKSGSQITWSSPDGSANGVISLTAQGQKPAGVVARTDTDKTVRLTATLSLSGQTKTKEFTLTVKKAPENLDTDYTSGYLWTMFDANGGYEKIFYGYSEDGKTWKKLNNKNPLLAVNDLPGSDKGVRDPHVIRSAEGDKYWLLGTDLHAEGGGAGGSGWNSHGSSKNLLIWESDDLVTWSEPRLVHAGLDSAGCVWAPEAIYDDATGEYVVYWSARDERNHPDDALMVYVCRTRDFYSFTEPQVWLDETAIQSNKGINIIDSSILKVGEWYYRFSTSDWNTVIDRCQTLSDLPYSAENESKGGWQRIMSRGTHETAGLDGMEGLTGYFLPSGDIAVMGDNNSYRGFSIPQADLESGAANKSLKFTKFGGSFPDGKFRHGTVLRLSETEEFNILKAYGDASAAIIDRTELQALYNAYKDETQSDYIGGWEAFETALEEAKAVLDNAASTDLQCHKAGTALKSAYAGLRRDLLGKPLEDNNGLELRTLVEEEDDYTGGKMLHMTSGWNNQDQGHAVVKDATPLQADTFTVLMDFKMDSQPNSDVTYRETFFSVGTDVQQLRVLASGKLGYGTPATEPNKGEAYADFSAQPQANQWCALALVYNDGKAAVYLNGQKVLNETDIGFKIKDLSNIQARIARAYATNNLRTGYYDNILIIDSAMSETDACAETLKRMKDKAASNLITGAFIGTYPEPPGASEDPDNTPDAWKGLDDHTAVSAKVDLKNKAITSYVQPEADLTQLPVNLSFSVAPTSITVNGKPFTNGDTVDLSSDAALTVTVDGTAYGWTIEKPKIAYNPVLPGQFADPDIDYFADNKGNYKYWLVATTDGHGGQAGRWTSYDFHLFSSENLYEWKDEGIILDVKNKGDLGNNINGRKIGTVDWSVGSAWAPTIEKKNDKYYFYFCAKRNGGTSCIGVAVADDPLGPYTAQPEPLLTPEICNAAGAGVGQTIDPSIYTENGRSYILFGNGSAAVAELNDDMVSIKPGTMKKYSGLNSFRESVIVHKIGDTYHFTWSCDDAGSENYHVRYGTADSVYGPVTYKYELLKKDTENDMLATAHQSILQDPKSGKIYLAYHRFFTPLGVYTNSRYFGIHRESCINELPYNPETGLMEAIKPTMEGVKGDTILADGSVWNGEVVNRVALQTLYDENRGLEKDASYDDGDWNTFTAALAGALDALNTASAQKTVDDAQKALQDAVNGLTGGTVTGIVVKQDGKVINNGDILKVYTNADHPGHSVTLTAEVMSSAANKAVNWTRPEGAKGQITVERTGIGECVTITAIPGETNVGEVLVEAAAAANENFKVTFKVHVIRQLANNVSISINGVNDPTAAPQFGQTLTADVNQLKMTDAGKEKLAYQWRRNGEAIEGAAGKTYTLTRDDIGAEVSVDVIADPDTFYEGTRSAARDQKVEKADGPARGPQGLTGSSDGTISGFGKDYADYEYRPVEGAAWIPVGAEVIEGLAPDTYEVRAKETDTQKAGEAVRVTVKESDKTYYEITLSDFENGNVQRSADAAEAGAEITLMVTPVNGYELDVLTVRDEDGSEVVLDKKSAAEYTFTMPAKDVTVSAAFTKRKLTIDHANIEHLRCSLGTADSHEAEYGEKAVIRLIPDEGYEFDKMSVMITNANGDKITGYTVGDDGTITIEGGVTSDLKITAYAVVKTYAVNYTLTAGLRSESERSVKHGEAYAGRILLVEGTAYRLPSSITVKMNGVAFTDFTYNASTGTIVIEKGKITGNLVIIASGSESPNRPDNSGTPSRPSSGNSHESVTDRKPSGSSKSDDEKGPSAPSVPSAPSSPAANFGDVKPSDWFQSAVNYVSANKIMTGSGGRFAPNDNLTRGMAAQILFNLEKAGGSYRASFPDVKTSDWFAPAVSWASQSGVMTGYSSGHFGPNDALTREQLAATLYRYATMKGWNGAAPGSLAGFADSALVSDWAKDAVGWAVGNGLLSGKSNGLLDPAGKASRAEIASILMRFCENVIP